MNTIGDLQRFFLIAVADNGAELITTQTRQDVVRAKTLFKLSCYLAQQTISSRMAPRVITRTSPLSARRTTREKPVPENTICRLLDYTPSSDSPGFA